MNKKELIFTLFKITALIVFLSIGASVAYQAFQMLQQKPPSDKSLDFTADIIPRAGAPVGTIKVRLEPTDAFVIGDKITADIEVDVNLLHENENESISVLFTFLDCLSTDHKWAWTNSSHYNQMTIPEYNNSMATYSAYKARAFVWFTHEGIFGANVTVYSPYSLELTALPSASLEGTVNWSFPEMIHIKSYDYVEQKANTQFTNALSLGVLGLTIITIGPVAMEIVSLSERAYDSIVEKQKDASTPEPRKRRLQTTPKSKLKDEQNAV